MYRTKFFLMLLITTMFFSCDLIAKLNVKFYGYQFLRYTYNLEDKTDSGLRIKRTYIRWKMKNEEEGWKSELTFDIANEKGGQVVDAETSTTTPSNIKGKIDFAIWPKYAYVEFSKIPLLQNIGTKIKIGLQKNYFGSIDLWEYPLIEKTITDLRGVIPSADFGISIHGNLVGEFAKYQIAMHNGSGYKHLDSNTEKQWSGNLMIFPVKEIIIRGSYMLNNQSSDGKNSAFKRSTDILIQYSGNFLSFKTVLSGEYVVVTDELKRGNGKSGCSEGYMIFGSIELTDKVQIGLRYDNWNEDTQMKNDEENLYIAGINFRINSYSLLQLNYLIKQQQFGKTNTNKIMAQLKWKW